MKPGSIDGRSVASDSPLVLSGAASPTHALSVPSPASARAELIVPQPMGDSATLAQPGGGVDARSLLASLRRRWLPALSLGLLLGGATAAVAWFLMPQTFTAFSELQVHSGSRGTIFVEHSSGAQFQNFRQTQARMLASPFVLNTALRDPKVAGLQILKNRPEQGRIEWLEKQLKITSPATEFLRISLTEQNPSDVAALVNSIVDAYLEEVANSDQKARRERLIELRAAQTKLRDDLRTNRGKLRRLTEQVGSSEPQVVTGQELTRLQFVAELRKQFVEMRFDEWRAKSELEQLTNPGRAGAESELPPAEAIEAIVTQEPKVAPIQKEVDDLKRSFANLERTVKPDSKKLLDMHAKLKAAEQRLETAKESAKEVVLERVREVHQTRSKETVEQLKTKIEQLKSHMAELDKELQNLAKTSKTTSLQSLDLLDLRGEIQRVESIEDRLSDEIVKLELESKVDARVTRFRPAEVPSTPDTGKKLKVVGGSGLGVMFLVVGGIVWLDLRTRRINSLDEVVGGLRLPVIGSLPCVPRRATSTNANDKSNVWQGTLIESVDSARVMLLRRAQLENAKVAMVVSAMSSEGKTTLSCHLATSLARAGYKTLLVDGDIRRPTVHRVFELPNEPGLCEVMRKEAELAETVVPTSQDGLYFLSAGQLTNETLRELAQDAVGGILKKLRDDFDFIILDSSPILPVTDSLLFSQHADGVIFSIRRDVSQYPKVASACQRLAMMGVPLWGAVVIGLDPTTTGYGYSYGYGYGYQTTRPS